MLFATATSPAATAPAVTAAARALPPGLDPFANPDPFPSTYRTLPSPTPAIINADILTPDGPEIPRGVIVMSGGKIVAVGADAAIPTGARVIDAHGRTVTPGLIDPHSHLGVYPSPGVAALSDGNEATDPDTAQVWAEHSVWPQDPGFAHALARRRDHPGNPAGLGQSLRRTLGHPAKRRGHKVQAMKFPGAPYDLKMACGENPNGSMAPGPLPFHRMGNVAGYRAAWIQARATIAQMG